MAICECRQKQELYKKSMKLLKQFYIFLEPMFGTKSEEVRSLTNNVHKIKKSIEKVSSEKFEDFNEVLIRAILECMKKVSENTGLIFSLRFITF